MLETVFRENWSELLEAFARIEASDEPPLEQLGAIAKTLLRAWRDQPDLVRVMVREVARSPQLQGQVDEIGAGFLAIQRVIERGQADGSFRDDVDPRLASWIFYGGLEEILTGWVLGQLPDGDEEVARAERTVVALLRGGLSGTAQQLPSEPGYGRVVWTLGLGAFGLAFSLTTTAAYLPPLLGQFTTSATLIALVLAAEGLFAITLPLVIGPWSDTFHTPLGRRRPFMLVALGPIGFCLALMAFMPSLWTTALLVFAFFFAYYVYEPPYRGLYPDLLPERIFGRAQSAQHLMRGLALGTALIGGGALFHVWEPFPFLVAALVVVAACAAPVLFVREDGGHGRVFEGVRAYLQHSWKVFRRDPEVRRFLIANTAWEGAFAGARTFVVLYLTVGLGQPLGTTTAVLAAVAAGYIVAAAGSGVLGDRFGLSRVIALASTVYGLGLLLGGFGDTVAAVVPAGHLPRRDRGRDGDDARLGPPLQADAAGRPGRDLRARDDDEGDRPAHGPVARRRRNRPPLRLARGHGRLPGALADPRHPGPARDPARLAPLSGRARCRGGTARKPRADHLGRRTRSSRSSSSVSTE